MQWWPKTAVDYFLNGIFCLGLVLLSKHSVHIHILEWIFFIIGSGLISYGFVKLLMDGE